MFCRSSRQAFLSALFSLNCLPRPLHTASKELAIYDLLTRPNMVLTEQEKAEDKKVARNILETLKREKPVFDWGKKQQAKAGEKARILKLKHSVLLSLNFPALSF
jgi:hypothetical protein